MTVRGYVLISLCAASIVMAGAFWQAADVDRARASAATSSAVQSTIQPVATATSKSVPAAPTNLRLTGAVEGLVWTDNSTNETSFVVTATDNGSKMVQKFSLPANTTSFQLPPGARANCADDRPSMSYAVMAVNAAGASEPATAAIRSSCPGKEAPVTADTMVVSGFAPAAPGALIVVEALDPVSIRGIECTRGQAREATTGGPGYSRFSLIVGRDCVQRASGNLRVCWGEGQCQGFEFQPGREVDLGVIVLRTPIASAPDVGFGAGTRRDSIGIYGSVRALAAAGLAFVGVGVLLLAGSRLAQLRSRHG